MYLSGHCSISDMACCVEPKMDTTKDPKNRQFSDRGIVSSLSCIYFALEVLVLLLCQYSSGCPKQASAWTSAVKPRERELIPHHDGIIWKTPHNNNVFNQQFYMLNLNFTPGHSPPINQATPTIVILTFSSSGSGSKWGTCIHRAPYTHTPIPPIPQCNERATARLTKSRGYPLPRSIRRWWSPFPTVPMLSRRWYSLICP
jgi:hypothetical protein